LEGGVEYRMIWSDKLETSKPKLRMTILPHTRSCFVCGEFNPIGFQLRFEADQNTVRVPFRPRTEHAGFKGTVHGGILATLLDELMFWACAARTRRPSYCAEMSVRYIAPARIGEELMATGVLVANRRDRLYEASGELRLPGGGVVATSTGKYIPLKDSEVTEMLTDLVGNIEYLKQTPRKTGRKD
jgi:uncharacterized protein (TIGR00369 family)